MAGTRHTARTKRPRALGGRSWRGHSHLRSGSELLLFLQLFHSFWLHTKTLTHYKSSTFTVTASNNKQCLENRTPPSPPSPGCTQPTSCSRPRRVLASGRAGHRPGAEVRPVGTMRAAGLERLMSGNHREVQAHFVKQAGGRSWAGTTGSGADGCQEESCRDSGRAARRSPSRVSWGGRPVLLCGAGGGAWRGVLREGSLGS